MDLSNRALLSLSPLRKTVTNANTAIKRAFDLFILATMTSELGVSWLTDEQLVYRV